MKKFLLPILIVTIIVQIFVPTYMIWDKYNVLKTGEEIKIKVAPIDPYDAFRGRYVSLQYNYDINYSERKGKYGIIEVGEDGFAFVKSTSNDKPDSGLYLTSRDDNYFYIPLDRYYMEETLASKTEKILFSEEREAYVTMRIKDDKAVLSGLYINGKPAEELVTESDK